MSRWILPISTSAVQTQPVQCGQEHVDHAVPRSLPTRVIDSAPAFRHETDLTSGATVPAEANMHLRGAAQTLDRPIAAVTTPPNPRVGPIHAVVSAVLTALGITPSAVGDDSPPRVPMPSASLPCCSWSAAKSSTPSSTTHRNSTVTQLV